MGISASYQPRSPSDLLEAFQDGKGGVSAFPIIGVGASAGGLEAFTHLLAHFPGDTGVALVLIQHLDPNHESRLSDLLSRVTPMPVTEATEGMTVRPNHVYVIPPNTNMAIARGVLRIMPREARGQHLPIDFFLRSLADDQQAKAIGVILSGSGADGTLGLTEVKAAGGITFAQDQDSAKFASMPLSAIASGIVDFILPPEAIAQELARVGRHPYLIPASPAARSQVDASEEEAFRRIIALLQSAFGVDFTQYRETTIRRRAMRRMALHSEDACSGYVRQLERDHTELQALYHDILINVTSFFRDPAMFEVLNRDVFPAILKTKTPQTPIRVWTAGCSTGQEAYSLAIALSEFLDEKPVRPPIQIFATDLSDTVSLEKARAGLYPESIEAELSPERLRRFFTKENGKYRISKSIRDLCVFARQNIAADPPYSRMDLISCRNVLIYLTAPPQRRIIATFHYALNPNGFLILGASETVGAFADLFAVVDKTYKIYSRRASALRQYPHFNAGAYLSAVPGAVGSVSQPSPTAADLQKEADGIVLDQYAPAGVLVSATLEILQFRGRTSPYLEPAPGEASLNLLKMAREGLFVELKSALDEAKEEGAPAQRLGVRVRDNADRREVNLKVIPVKLTGMSESCFLVLFEEARAQPGRTAGPRPVGTSQAGSWLKRLFASPWAARRHPTAKPTTPDGRDRELVQLRRELIAAREQQQSTIEQYNSAIDELKSANEEILSSNEELQSTNEELETAKEELQSVNEELTTVNEQLQYRNLELDRLTNDLTNLLGSANIPIVMLGSDLRIRRFTPAAGKVLNLLPADVGRPIGDLRLTVEVPDLEQLLLDVIASVQVKEREVRDREGRWHALRIHPYRTADNKIDGTVVVLGDIDEAKRALVRLKEAGDYAQAIVETVRERLLILTAELRVNSANQSFYETFQVTPGETENQFVFDLEGGRWDNPRLRTLLDDVVRSGVAFDEFEIEHELPGLGERVMLLNARRLVQLDGATHQILLAFEDITERRRSEARVRSSEIRYRRLFESARDGILMLDPDTRKITDVNPFMTEFFGYSREEFLGKELWEIGLLKDADAARSVFQELQERGDLRFEELSFESKDGSRREVEIVSNLYQEGGHRVIQCNIRDITARKRAERLSRQSEERFQSIVTQVTAGIVQTDLTGRFLMVNQRFCDIVGYSQEELSGMRMQDITHAEDLPRHDSLVQQLVQGGPGFVVEKRYVRKGGSPVWVNHSVSTLRDAFGARQGLVAVVIDISQQKQAEAALKEADRRKNEFLAVLGHELRNPLAAMSHATELIILAGDDHEAVAWSQEVIGHQVKVLVRLVDDLLDIARITQGKVVLRKESVEFGPLIRRAVAMVGHQIDVQRHELSVSLPTEAVWLHGDPMRLEQVIVNLLHNAVKYTDPGGRIGLEVERQGQEVFLVVRDSGVGISPEMLPHVFDLFTQVERSSDRSKGGLGIGLTLVHSLVEKHGGSVSVSSTPGAGSTFTVRLPLEEGGAEQRPAATSTATQVPPRRILIVDDNADMARGMARLLGRQGHDVQTAFDGPSGLEAARAYRPEIVLLDIDLPGMDGYEVGAWIRREERLKDVVIIAISGYGPWAASSRSLEPIFDHHLVKPVSHDELLTHLGRVNQPSGRERDADPRE